MVSLRNKLPKLKRSLKDFIEDESGIINKETLLKGGIALGGILVLSQSVLAHHVQNYEHTNNLSLAPKGESAMGEHEHSVRHVSGC